MNLIFSSTISTLMRFIFKLDAEKQMEKEFVDLFVHKV